jgi:hypothetical protein
VDAQVARYRSARAVFEATWREALGSRWPNLAGDVEALCDRAFALGYALGRAQGGPEVGDR